MRSAGSAKRTGESWARGVEGPEARMVAVGSGGAEAAVIRDATAGPTAVAGVMVVAAEGINQ